MIQFSKLQGSGNDFIVVSAECCQEESYADLAKQMCDRHFGVGADGLIFFRRVPRTESAFFRMRIFNADGGEAELSGNGLRCLATHLHHGGLHQDREVQIETLAGLKKLSLIRCTPPEYVYAVEMGQPILDRTVIGFEPEEEPALLTDCRLKVGNRSLSVTVTSMGNPHCSIFVDNFEELEWERLGAQIELHPAFINRTNVEFIRIRNRKEIEVRFWERGVGKTNASGTGSCAAVIASVLRDLTEREVKVHTLGGILEVSWRLDNSIHLSGPARLICKGDFYV